MPDGGCQGAEGRYEKYLDSGNAAKEALLSADQALREKKQAEAFGAFRNIIQMHIIAEIIQVNPGVFKQRSPLMLITNAVGKCVEELENRELESGGVGKIEEFYDRVIEINDSTGGQSQREVEIFIQETTEKLLAAYSWLDIPREVEDIEGYFAKQKSDQDLEIAA